MDKINGLPDDVLVKILSFLPTKEAVSTCVLSNRWEFLWMWLTKLEFNSMSDPRPPGLGDFIDKKLPLHRAPVIESMRLHITCNSHIKPKNVKRWIEIAISRCVRELQIDYYPYGEKFFIFPSSLFTCKSLVTLKLQKITHMDVPTMVCLLSLKTLQLETTASYFFVDGESLQRLLSGCPVLEDLSLSFEADEEQMKEFTIIIPSLQSLSLFVRTDGNFDGYEINTPSLKYLKLVDWTHEPHHYSLIKNMPRLREAYVDILSSYPKNQILGSITSVKRLTICCLEDLDGDGCVFTELEHLSLCLCKKDSCNLLGQFLNASPNLRVLDICVMKGHSVDMSNGMVCWNQQTSVPECMLSSLQIVSWSPYFARQQDRDIVAYILKYACHLKKATILVNTWKYYVPEVINELRLLPRASTTCQLSIR